MLHSKARWNEVSNISKNKLEENMALEISPIVQKLLIQRGITTASEANRFLSPDLDALHHPNQITDIDKAAKRVHEAIAEKEKILVFGDYDADGVTSTALLIKTLRELEADCDYYIPNRFTEGYGPNETAFKQAYENGVSLIITVDTGISANHEATVAKKLGMDLIITDHHEVQNEKPDAFAIIHPSIGNSYPFTELAGVGVAFKFAQYLLGYFPKKYLAYVAIGTIADLVPLRGENRILSYYGLKELTTNQIPGIKQLKKICGIEGIVTEEDVGFKIGPRLNAVGRLQDAGLAVDLLLTDSMEVANQIADEVDLLNRERQHIVKEIATEAEEMVDPKERDVIIVGKEGWNEGVLGIVASRLVQKFDRPAIVLTYKEESKEWKGSARSIPAFDLFKNCMKVHGLFSSFGGHKQAAGMTLPEDNLEPLRTALGEMIKEQLSEDDFKQEITIADTVEVNEISETLIDEIALLSPFGMDNPKPVFKINEIPSSAKQIGSNKNHLKVQFHVDGVQLDGIGFGIGELYPAITPNTPIDFVGELSINEWNGNRKVQMIIRDMKVDEWQLFDYRGKKNYNLSGLNKESTLFIRYNVGAKSDEFKSATYSEDISKFKEIENLVLIDLPPQLTDLETIIQQLKPVNIYACYHIEDSAYLTSFPEREDFAWVYTFFRKKEIIDLKKEIPVMMRAKSWSKERVIFITQVFSDLDFVKIEDGFLSIKPTTEKKDLTESIHYQERLERRKIEEVLYYSNYKQLKERLQTMMNYIDSREEEIANEL